MAAAELGETLIDSGSKSLGSIAAGLRIAEICMGGLARCDLVPSQQRRNGRGRLSCDRPNPVIACLASQYAGWRLSHEEGGSSFFALGSGPARALARREPLFEVLTYADSAARAVLVIESTGRRPQRSSARSHEIAGLIRRT